MMGRMNWKRGLTRIYVVLWVLLAVGGVVIAVSASSDAMRERKKVADFLKPHLDRLTLADLQRLSLDSLRARVAKRFIKHEGVVLDFPRDATDDDVRRALGLSPSDSLQKIPTYDFAQAQRAGASVAQIADVIARERAAGRDLRSWQTLPSELFTGLLDRGLTSEQVEALDMGGASDEELEALRASASSDALARPVAAFAGIWGLWVGVCLAAPAIILWTLRWIASGFGTSGVTP